jgi:hypothetical protein
VRDGRGAGDVELDAARVLPDDDVPAGISQLLLDVIDHLLRRPPPGCVDDQRTLAEPVAALGAVHRPLDAVAELASQPLRVHVGADGVGEELVGGGDGAVPVEEAVDPPLSPVADDGCRQDHKGQDDAGGSKYVLHYFASCVGGWWLCAHPTQTNVRDRVI